MCSNSKANNTSVRDLLCSVDFPVTYFLVISSYHRYIFAGLTILGFLIVHLVDDKAEKYPTNKNEVTGIYCFTYFSAQGSMHKKYKMRFSPSISKKMLPTKSWPGHVGVIVESCSE